MYYLFTIYAGVENHQPIHRFPPIPLPITYYPITYYLLPITQLPLFCRSIMSALPPRSRELKFLVRPSVNPCNRRFNHFSHHPLRGGLGSPIQNLHHFILHSALRNNLQSQDKGQYNFCRYRKCQEFDRLPFIPISGKDRFSFRLQETRSVLV